ncbi:MAG: cupredoxin domain-containing protein [Acidimicrobiales bacterium]
MRTRLMVLLAIVAPLVAACGGGDDDADGGSGGQAAAGGPVTVPVSVDAQPDEFSASFFSYFPRQLTARPGDTVEFTSDFSGEPHTVALGTLVNEGLTAFKALPAGTPLPQEIRDQLNRLPFFFAVGVTDLDADPQPAAAQSCFLPSGAPPLMEACSPAQQEQPDFNGTETFYSSGFLPDEAKFPVRLADDIAPGTYQFMCLVNRTQMTGEITVVAKEQDVPTPAELRATAQRQIDAAVAALQPRADKVLGITTAAAMAGAPSEEGAPKPPVPSTVNVFPDEVSIPAGGAVTWTVNGAHTIAFGSPEDARPLYAFDGAGMVKSNKKGVSPVGGPGMPQGASPPFRIDGGSYEAGFRNSGLLVGSGDVQYKLTFPKAGTYEYRCLFHTDMEGTVKVG